MRVCIHEARVECRERSVVCDGELALPHDAVEGQCDVFAQHPVGVSLVRPLISRSSPCRIVPALGLCHGGEWAQEVLPGPQDGKARQLAHGVW